MAFSDSNTQGFSLELLYISSLRYWGVILAGFLLGGLLGLGVTRFRMPQYEASATILISVDRNRASIRDDITIYQADDRVRALILADDTLWQAMELLNRSDAEQKFDTPSDFRSQTRITQKPASIDLLFYANDPYLAAEAANAWASASISELEKAFIYAVRAAELQQAIYEAHCELDLRVEGTDMRAVWVCVSENSELNAEDLPHQLLEEAKASRGILPFYSFSLGQAASVPQAPILWSRNLLILSGLFLGAILGFLIAVILNLQKYTFRASSID